MFLKTRRKIKQALSKIFKNEHDVKETKDTKTSSSDAKVVQQIVEEPIKPEVDKPVKSEVMKQAKKEAEEVLEVKENIIIDEKEDGKEKNENDTSKKGNKKINKGIKYHVSQNKDEDSEFFKKWRVRKEGSNKTIKYFNTQREAIDYAESLAENMNSSIVIHKVDGSIRKQDYSKKDKL